jgi:DNA polymerase III epsilon subunit-like protein
MIHGLFDTETTDLIKNTAIPLHKQPRVIEFFGILWNDEDGSERVITSLINPGIPIPEKSTQITGITDEMVKGAPFFANFLPDLVEFFGTADRIIAHNLSYDKTIIQFEFSRLGSSLILPAGTCTVEMTEHLKGFRLSLSALYEYLFNEPFAGAHRAEADVRAMLRCYRELISRGEI